MKRGKGFFRNAILLGSFLTCTLFGFQSTLNNAEISYAAEFSVTPTSCIMYTNDKTVVYASADLMATVITGLSANLPVTVTGITSNGWYQVTANGAIYYIPSYGLNKTVDSTKITETTTNTSIQQKVKKAIKGTFSYYSEKQLEEFTEEDIEDMNANEYIKYLDSYLAGKGSINNAIKLDTGIEVGKEYETKKVLNAKMTASSVTEYLLDYRNSYLMDSFWGPVDTIDDVKISINRAIRYNVNSFNVVCHQYDIGDSELKMQSKVNKLIQQMKDEQGITFEIKQSYGKFTDKNGNSASGFILEIEKK